MVAPGVWHDDGPVRPVAEARAILCDAGVEPHPAKRREQCPEPGCELRHPRSYAGCKLHGTQDWAED